MSEPPSNSGSLGRVMIVVFVLFTAAVASLAVAYHGAQKKNLERLAAERLAAIAHLKVSQIQHWRNNLKSDGEWLQESTQLRAIAQAAMAAPSDATAQAEMRDWIASWSRHNPCLRIVLLDAGLQPKVGSVGFDAGMGPGFESLANVALSSNIVVLGDMRRDSPTGSVHMDLIVPLVIGSPGSQARPFALLITEIDLQAYLFPLIQSWPSPSRSGETLLVRRDDDEVLFLNELRHRAGTAMALKAPMSQTNLPAVHAVLGEHRVVKGIDYRSHEVMAALEPVTGSPWFVVSKEDLGEVHEPLTELAWTVGSVALVILLAGAAGIGALWSRRESRFALAAMREHQQAEEAAKAIQRRFQQIYDAMTEMLVLHDMVYDDDGKPVDYRILDSNAAFTKITGISRERAIGALASQLYGTREAPFLEIYARVAATGVPEQFESFFAPMGRHFAIAVFRPQHGSFATLASDITERIRQRKERQTLLHELEQKTKDLESIIYIASHDLRSPLVNIQGFTARLQTALASLGKLLDQPTIPEAVRHDARQILQTRVADSMRFIRAGSERLNSLVRSLLVLSRAGRDVCQPMIVDMDKVVKSVLDSIRFQLESSRASVCVDALPPCLGHPQDLGQIMANLIDNAIKYRDPNRPLEIRIQARNNGSGIEYSVQDNGVGIAPEHQEKIWELFRRLHPETPSQGDGIGLSIVRRLVARMRGRAWVVSTPGQGSSFHIALPIPSD